MVTDMQQVSSNPRSLLVSMLYTVLFYWTRNGKKKTTDKTTLLENLEEIIPEEN